MKKLLSSLLSIVLVASAVHFSSFGKISASDTVKLSIAFDKPQSVKKVSFHMAKPDGSIVFVTDEMTFNDFPVGTATISNDVQGYDFAEDSKYTLLAPNVASFEVKSGQSESSVRFTLTPKKNPSMDSGKVTVQVFSPAELATVPYVMAENNGSYEEVKSDFFNTTAPTGKTFIFFSLPEGFTIKAGNTFNLIGRNVIWFQVFQGTGVYLTVNVVGDPNTKKTVPAGYNGIPTSPIDPRSLVPTTTTGEPTVMPGVPVPVPVEKQVLKPEPSQVVQPTVPVQTECHFTDDAADAAVKLCKLGIIDEPSSEQAFGGISKDNAFRAAEPLSRAEFTKLVMLLTYSPEEIDSESSYEVQNSLSPFPDVDPSDWFASYVITAKKEGHLSGYPTGDFVPSKTIEVGEALKILFNAAGRDNVGIKADLEQEKLDEHSVWFQPYAELARKYHGFEPEAESDDGMVYSQTLTRGWAADLLVTIIENASIEPKSGSRISELKKALARMSESRQAL